MFLLFAFCVLCVFLENKNRESNVLCLFSLFFLFLRIENSFFKTRTKNALNFFPCADIFVTTKDMID